MQWKAGRVLVFVLFRFVLFEGGKANGQDVGTLKRRSVWVCWVVITKYHRVGNFRNSSGFSRSSGGSRYKASVSGLSRPLGLPC